jgi:subtilisin
MPDDLPRRFIVLPTRGFTASANTGERTHDVLHRLQRPGVVTFKAAGAPVPKLLVRVLSSLHDDGPKLVELTENEAFALRVAHPGLRVVPEVRFHLARAPHIAVTAGKRAFPSANLAKVKLTIVTKKGGVPLPDVHVVAFTDFAKRTGAEGVTNAKGQVSLSLPQNTTTLERVYLYAEHTAWPMIARNVAVAAGPIGLPEIDLAFADSRVKANAPFDPKSGKGVKVGVLDTGAGPHDALVIGKGVSTVYDDTDQTSTDTIGHGTHVAGIIAARGAAFSGIAPAVTLNVYRVFGRSGAGASNFDIAKAMDIAVADGCDLLNLSLGGGPMDPVTDEAIKAARAKGTICVIASGNDGGPVSNPGAHPLVVCVSAMGFKDAWPSGAVAEGEVTKPLGKSNSFIASFSNTGPEIDLTGAGCGIMSTYPQNRFAVMDGTSMACPCATGAIARRLAKAASVLGARRDATRSDQIVKLALAETKDLGFPPSKQGAGLRT